MSNILITGANGFIGTHLCNLLKDSIYLCKYINHSGSIKDNHHFNLIINRDTDYGCCLQNIDVVVHLAARVHITKETSENSLADFMEVNTLGTLNLARQASFFGVKRFIYISTINTVCDSNQNITSFIPSVPPDCLSPYSLSKYYAERDLMNFCKGSSLEFTIIRPALVYGYGVKANFATLYNIVGKKIPLPFKSIRNNKRSFLSVHNLVDLIKICISHPAASNQIFNVSDDYDLSTSDLISLMANVQGVYNYSFPFPVWCFNILGSLLNKQDVVDRLVGSLQVDITHTKETLDWKPPYSVEEGFAMCVENKKGKK